MNAVTHAPTAVPAASAAPDASPAPDASRAADVCPAAVTSPAPSRSFPDQARAVLPGLALAVAVAAVATVVGEPVPLLCSPVPGAVIGAVIALVIKPGERLAPGVRYASTFLLQCSVVLLGTQ